MSKVVKIATLLAGIALLGGGAGWYGLASGRAPGQAVPAVNREIEELLAQVEAGAPNAAAASAPVSAPSVSAASATVAAPPAAPSAMPSPSPAADQPIAAQPAAPPAVPSPPPSLSPPAHSSGSLPVPPPVFSAPAQQPSPPALHAADPSTAAPSSAIDLNAATLEQLLTLPGIGESKGRAILELRGRLGSFRSVEQLKDVKGIGDKTMAKLRPLVRIGNS